MKRYAGVLVGVMAGLVCALVARQSLAAGACCNIQAQRFRSFGAIYTHAKAAGATHDQHSGSWWIASVATAASFRDQSDDEVGVRCDLDGVDRLVVTDPCAGWKYRWGARGSIGGRVHARASATILSSAYAAASGAVQLSRNLALFGEGHVVATDDAEGSVTVGVGSEGGVGMTWTTGSQASSSDNATQPVGGVNGKTQTQFGPGPEVQVGIEMTTEVYVHGDSFFNVSWAPHKVAARGFARVTVVAPLRLGLACRGPNKWEITELDEPADPDPPLTRTGDITPSGIDWHPATPVTPTPLTTPPAWPPSPPYSDPDEDGWWSPP